MLESKPAVRNCLLLFGLLSFACGKTPTGPVTPTPPPVPTYSVSVLAFVDDNGDGTQNTTEPAIVPYADVEIDGHVATTAEGTGGATVTGVPAGTYPVNFKKLPPFFTAGAAKTITVPQTGGPLLLPVVQSMGDNIPQLFLSSGDSISQGDPGSIDKKGFRTPLEAKLRAAFLRTSMQYRGGGGLASDVGAGRTQRDLNLIHPSYVLIDWGMNDWNPQPTEECQADPASPDCHLIDNLHSIVETVRNGHAFPCLATLTLVNTTENPPQRTDWIKKANGLIRTLAQQDGALLVDMEDAFSKSGQGNALLFDAIHPNDTGYALMADTWFKAITTGTVTATGYQPPVLLPLSGGRAAASLARRR
jgi:lysophospholipase L1-like esterase